LRSIKKETDLMQLEHRKHKKGENWDAKLLWGAKKKSFGTGTVRDGGNALCQKWDQKKMGGKLKKKNLERQKRKKTADYTR